MQIEAFVLYHRDGQRRRVLKLNETGLSVITGWRRTGKSSLLDIVEYCFGRSTLTVSQGVIRRTVGWYGLVLRVGETFAFAGRPTPRDGAATTGDAMFLPLADREPPSYERLEVNSSVDSLREQLSALGGFADAVFHPPADAVRPPLRLHIAHTLPVCLQDEEDIDSRSHLFHRGHDRDVMQALRDALPYAVGASDAETQALRVRLSEVRRDGRQVQRDLARLEAAAEEADTRARTLLTDAEAVGLSSTPSDEPTAADAQAALRVALTIDPDDPPSSAPSGEVERLLAERRELHERLSAAERNEALLRDFGADQAAYVRETNEQRARLATIGLLRHDGDPETCPLCTQRLDNADPLADALIDDLHQLADELTAVEELEPRARRAIEASAEVTAELRKELRTVNDALRDLAQRDEAAKSARTLAARRAYVQGAIAEYLRLVAPSDEADRDELEARAEQLDEEAKALEARLDPEAERERLAGALNLIGADMTALSRRLRLEHSEGQVRLDFRRMSVVVDTLRDGSFALDGIGSAGNRVGYHLATHLALHKLLRERDRPVPAFLILDHPTGPFYPDDVPEGTEPQLRKEDDRAIVKLMFELVRDVVTELNGRLQVLICDHANLDEQWFRDAVVEDWRDGRGLIPAGWDVGE